MYQLRVQMTGFRKFERTGIQLLVNTGETTVVNTTGASIGNAFSEGQIKNLPMEAERPGLAFPASGRRIQFASLYARRSNPACLLIRA